MAASGGNGIDITGRFEGDQGFRIPGKSIGGAIENLTYAIAYRHFRQVQIDAYHTVDLGIEQVLCKKKWLLDEAVLRLYVKNLFDATYSDTSGFPATDRTVGVSFSMRF